MVEAKGQDFRTMAITLYKEQAEEENVSQLTIGDQSYIMDLTHQKHFRQDRRQEEAMEEALGLYRAAVEEGAPKTEELFKLFMVNVLKELNEENREKDRLQDEWLEAALQAEMERRQKHEEDGGGGDGPHHNICILDTSDHHSRPRHSLQNPRHCGLDESLHQPPSIYNGTESTVLQRRISNVRMLELDQKIHQEEINILHKKINKVERMLKEIVDEKGETEAFETRKYKGYKKKLKEYKATLKKAQQQYAAVAKETHSIQYDWGTVDDDSGDEEEPASEMQKGSGGRMAGTSDDDDDDLEWAKQIVAAFTLNDDCNFDAETADLEEIKENEVRNDDRPVPNLVQHVNSPAKKDQNQKQKNISFSTVMATTQQLSGHEFRRKSANSGVHSAPLPTMLSPTQEVDEIEDPPTPKVPPKQTVRTLVSPFRSPVTVTSNNFNNAISKRKSPSWKHQETTPAANNTSTVNRLKKPLSSTFLLLSEDCPLEISLPVQVSPIPNDDDDHHPDSSDGEGFTLADFKSGKVKGIDMSNWEKHLSTAEFEKHFGMTRDAFSKLAKWKQLNVKRQLRTW